MQKDKIDSIAAAYKSMNEAEVSLVSEMFGPDHVKAMKAHKSQQKIHLQGRNEYEGFEDTHEWETYHNSQAAHHAAAHLHKQAHAAQQAGSDSYKSIASKANTASDKLKKSNEFH